MQPHIPTLPLVQQGDSLPPIYTINQVISTLNTLIIRENDRAAQSGVTIETSPVIKFGAC